MRATCGEAQDQNKLASMRLIGSQCPQPKHSLQPDLLASDSSASSCQDTLVPASQQWRAPGTSAGAILLHDSGAAGMVVAAAVAAATAPSSSRSLEAPPAHVQEVVVEAVQESHRLVVGQAVVVARLGGQLVEVALQRLQMALGEQQRHEVGHIVALGVQQRQEVVGHMVAVRDQQRQEVGQVVALGDQQ